MAGSTTGTENQLSGPRGYEVIEADLATDRDAILNLWALKTNTNIINELKLKWFYEQNPVGRGSVFLLQSVDEAKPVGTIGAVPRLFTNQGVSMIGMVMIDLVIDPAHRTLGPGLLLQRAASGILKSRADFIFSFPNSRAAILRRKLGYDEHRLLYQLVCPIDLRNYLPERTPSVLRKVLASLYRRIISLVWTIASRRCSDPVRMTSEFAGNLWSDLQSGEALIGNRDFKCLDWRLMKHPDKKVKVYCQERRDGAACGYVAYVTSDEDKVNIVDYACVAEVSVSILFAGFMREMLRLNVVSVALELDGRKKSDIRKLRLLGFQKRASSDVYFVHGQKSTAQFDFKDVDITRYDGDT